ncbi:MAG: T9SS type A sorting domain-containing protein [Calditrichaeota bacterium]|nr:T9SS type A sorting domain-containing protein [Calditrichota bacterium]
METRKLLVLFLVIGIISLAQSSFAQTEVERIGWTLNKWDNVLDIVIEGDYAYLSTRATGLQVVDISDPEIPTCVGYCYLPGDAQAVGVHNGYAYLSVKNENGTCVIDINDPTNPRLVNFIEDYCSFKDMSFADTIGYFGGRIMNLSDPENPDMISYIEPTSQVYDMVITDRYGYFANHDNIRIFRIFNLEDIRIASILPLESGSHGLAKADDYLYVANGGHGLKVVDVSTKTSPRLVTTYDDSISAANDVQVRDNFAFIAGVPELSVVDISDPVHPEYISDIGQESGESLALNDDYAYVANRGLKVFDVYDPENPDSISCLKLEMGATGIEIVGQLAYVADKNDGIYVLDISEPGDPQIIHTFVDGRRYYDIDVKDELVYVAGYGVRILNMADLDSIYEMSEISTRYAQRICVEGSLAFVCARNGDNDFPLYMFDISDPANPSEILRTEEYYWTCEAVGDLLFASRRSEGRLDIIDVSNPEEPQLIGGFRTGSRIEEIEISGDHCYLTTGESGLVILDISEPTEPELVSRYDTEGKAYEIEIEGDHAYLADYENGIIVLDISDPSSPQQIGYSILPRFAYRIGVSNGIVYLPEHYVLEIYDCRPVLTAKTEVGSFPEVFQLYPAYPNPFNSTTTIRYELPSQSHVSLQLYNTFGQQVNTLFEGYRQAGFHSATLSASDLPSGLYFVRLGVSCRVFTQKVMLIR